MPSATAEVIAREGEESLATPESCGVPSLSPSSGAARATSTTTVPTIVAHRRRSTRRATPAQNRLGPAWALLRGHSSRGPTPLSTTGTRVSEVATLNSGISRPPRPMLRRNGSGTSTRAASETATVMPLNSTL